MNIETHQQRHTVDPQQFARWRIDDGAVILSAGGDKWISAEKVVDIVQ